MTRTSTVDVHGLVRCLIERKQSLFADDMRFIFDLRTQQMVHAWTSAR
jgi:hypothetical protein